MQYNTIKSLKISRGSTVPKHNNEKEQVLLSNTTQHNPKRKIFENTNRHLPSTLLSNLRSARFPSLKKFQKSIKCQTNHLNRTKEQKKKKKNKRKPCLSIEPPSPSRQADQTGSPDRQTRPGRQTRQADF